MTRSATLFKSKVCKQISLTYCSTRYIKSKKKYKTAYLRPTVYTKGKINCVSYITITLNSADFTRACEPNSRYHCFTLPVLYSALSFNSLFLQYTALFLQSMQGKLFWGFLLLGSCPRSYSSASKARVYCACDAPGQMVEHTPEEKLLLMMN